MQLGLQVPQQKPDSTEYSLDILSVHMTTLSQGLVVNFNLSPCVSSYLTYQNQICLRGMIVCDKLTGNVFQVYFDL